jgi:hypothetical protein
MPPSPYPTRIQALRVSLGRLGIITRVHLRIVKETPINRSLTRLAPTEFLVQMSVLQEAARRAGNLSATGTSQGLPKWASDSEWFWIPQVSTRGPVAVRRAAGRPPVGRIGYPKANPLGIPGCTRPCTCSGWARLSPHTPELATTETGPPDPAHSPPYRSTSS